MDALWDLEDKWKISTRKAAVLLACTATLVFLVCTSIFITILRRKGHQRNRIASLDSDDESESSSLIMYEERSSCNKCAFFVKNVIVGSACWSMAHKWSNEDFMVKCKFWSVRKERNGVSNCMKFSDCLGSKLPPVWQRPILMGEKCEFPKFSGLILYDERGRPLPHCHPNQVERQVMEHYEDLEEEDAEIGGSRVMLKDLL